MTKDLEGRIDAFQRRLLSYVLDMKWCKKISSGPLKQIVKQECWSKTIRRRRLRWFGVGHIHRLPEQPSAQEALKEALRPSKKPTGRQKTTWIKTVEKDLEERNMTWNEAASLCK